MRVIEGKNFPQDFLDIYALMDLTQELTTTPQAQEILSTVKRGMTLRYDFFTEEELDQAKDRLKIDQIIKALEKLEIKESECQNKISSL